MTDDWYEKPKQETKPLPKWINLIWASIVCGIGAGVFIALSIIIHSYIFPKPSIFNLTTTQEIQTILFVIMFGATMGFIIGAPAALVFGPFIIWLTRNFNKKIQYLSRIIFGAIGGYIAFLIFNLFSMKSQIFEFSFNGFAIPCIAGAVGAIIFLYLKKE